MLNEMVLMALNTQLTRERQNAATYLALANRAGFLNLTGVEKFMRQASEEETEHAQKFIDYVIDRNAEPITALISPVIVSDGLMLLEAPSELFSLALQAEIANTAALEDLRRIAVSVEDWRTSDLLIWFLAEQTASERELSEFVARLQAATGDAAAVLAIDAALLSD